MVKREEIKIKDVLSVHLEVNSSINLADQIIELLKKEQVRDKIIIIRLSGILERGKISDIDFVKIEAYLKEKGAFSLLKSTSKLHLAEPEVKIELQDSEDLESHIIKKFIESNENKFNYLITDLLRAMQAEKLEDETSSTFEERLLSEARKVLIL